MFTRLQKRGSNTYTRPPYIHYLTTLLAMRRNLQWRLKGVLRLKWRFSLSVLPTAWRRRGQHLPYYLKFINVFDQAVSAFSHGSPTNYCNGENINVRCYGLIQPPSPKNAHYTYQCLHANLSTRSTPLAFWSQARSLSPRSHHLLYTYVKYKLFWVFIHHAFHFQISLSSFTFMYASVHFTFYVKQKFSSANSLHYTAKFNVPIPVQSTATVRS